MCWIILFWGGKGGDITESIKHSNPLTIPPKLNKQINVPRNTLFHLSWPNYTTYFATIIFVLLDFCGCYRSFTTILTPTLLVEYSVTFSTCSWSGILLSCVPVLALASCDDTSLWASCHFVHIFSLCMYARKWYTFMHIFIPSLKKSLLNITQYTEN